jgi:hypothetical protein
VTEVGGSYDADLQMFCPVVSEPDFARLHFLRWLAEQGRLEHEVSGPAEGQYASGPARN